MGEGQFSIVLGWWTLSLEVITRYAFGERYINVLRFYFALMVMNGLNIVPAMVGEPTSPLFPLLTLTMFALYLYHTWRIRQRNKRGVEWYSYSFGISHLERLQPLLPKPLAFLLDDWTIYRFTEPALLMALGIVFCSMGDVTVGIWLIGGSISLLIKNQLLYSHHYNLLLDIRDARIEQKYQQAALDGKPKQEVAGISVAPAFRTVIPEENTPDIDSIVADAMGKQEKITDVVIASEPQSALTQNS